MRGLQLDEIHGLQTLQTVVDAAEQAGEVAQSILFDPGFDDRIGWKLDAQNDQVTVHYKDINGKRHFAARTKVPLSCAVGQSLNWDHVDKMADWNENIKFSKLVGKIGDDIDLTHYASNEVLMVKSREFIVARKKLVFGQTLVVAAQSCSTELVKATGNSVMASLHLGVGRYIPDDQDRGHSRYDYVVAMDLKGMMPSYLVNQVLGKMVLSDVDNHRKNAVEYGKTVLN